MASIDLRLNQLNQTAKWGVTAFLLLLSLGFSVAALMSHQTYGFDHVRTVHFYLGDEAEGGMAMAKLYSQLVQTAHVHSFTMPLVFLTLWLGLGFTPIKAWFKNLLIGGGALAILIYNGAPFLVRYVSPKFVPLFTMGGVGLFVFSILPILILLYEIWRGFRWDPST